MLFRSHGLDGSQVGPSLEQRCGKAVAQRVGRNGLVDACRECRLAYDVEHHDGVKGVKIAVIGYSGAGKSTLAKKLGKLFRCPVLHLDRIQFEPGWKERDRETARRMAEDFLDKNENRGWIIDGNYTGFSQERRLREADLIIFMNYPRWILSLIHI